MPLVAKLAVSAATARSHCATSWQPAAVAMGKALVYQQRELGMDAAYQLAGQAMATNMMDAAAQEGARAFAEKRQPTWKH